jgi:outer membrane immunogenic protein
LAYGHVGLSGNATVIGSTPANPSPFAAASAFSASKTNVGFAVGGGVEGKLLANWTWKIEYLYLDLGSLDTVTAFPAANPFGNLISTPFTGSIATHTHFTDSVVHIGLNYRFGYAAATAAYN